MEGFSIFVAIQKSCYFFRFAVFLLATFLLAGFCFTTFFLVTFRFVVFRTGLRFATFLFAGLRATFLFFVAIIFAPPFYFYFLYFLLLSVYHITKKTIVSYPLSKETIFYARRDDFFSLVRGCETFFSFWEKKWRAFRTNKKNTPKRVICMKEKGVLS